MWDLWWTNWHWGHVFSEYFGFPCQFSFHQILSTYLSFGPGTIGRLVADVPSELSLTPPHGIKEKNIYLRHYLTTKHPRRCLRNRQDKELEHTPRLHIQPWRWRQNVPPKRSYRRTRLYEKTAIWTITALKRSKLMLHWSNLEVKMAFQNNADASR
jgi:hypothetical protein